MPQPPNPPQSEAQRSGSMRIGPFWKRSADAAMNPASEEPFDALTDLFLGEVSPPTSRLSPVARPGAAPTPPADGPILRLAGTDDDEAFGTVRPTLAPDQKNIPTRPAAPVLVMDKEDVGEAKAVAVILPPPTRNPVLECLVLGNLPVLASAWANQYVREIAAAASKPVAYLRVQAEFVGLELVGTLPEGVDVPRAEQLNSLEAAIDAAAEITDRWIVRCDSGQEGIVAASPLARALTILTGTDQMAREGCKSTFAALAERLPKSEAPVMVRLALMGTASEETKAAGVELASAASEALAREVPAIICATRIGGAKPAQVLFSGPTDLALATILKHAERALTPDNAGAWIARPVTVPPVPALRRAEAVAETAAEARDVFEVPLPAPTPTTAEIAAGMAPARREPEPVARPIVIEPAPVARPAASAPARPVPACVSAADSLVSHLVELKSLPIRCPYADGIEIAVDDGGSLHLLARSNSDASDDAALAALLVASSWSEAHAGILRGVTPRLAGEQRPTLHLFTDRPKRSRRLLETNLRVHLLAEVEVNGQAGWYCTELN